MSWYNKRILGSIVDGRGKIVSSDAGAAIILGN